MEIRTLSLEEEQARHAALALAAKLIGRSPPLTAEQVQALYEVILEEHSDFEEGLLALGIAFGELIVDKAGYEWVRVTDEWGSENSLSPIGWDICCHPISMIQKRIGRREAACLRELRDDTIHTVQKADRRWEGRTARGRGGPMIFAGNVPHTVLPQRGRI